MFVLEQKTVEGYITGRVSFDLRDRGPEAPRLLMRVQTTTATSITLTRDELQALVDSAQRYIRAIDAMMAAVDAE